MRTFGHRTLFHPAAFSRLRATAIDGRCRRAHDYGIASAAPALCLLPALLVAALLSAGGARADSSDELQIEGKLDVVELGGEAAHKETVEGMIKDLAPEIDSGRLTEAQLVRALAVRCWAYYERDLFDLAVADCNRVLSSRPDHGAALLRRIVRR